MGKAPSGNRAAFFISPFNSLRFLLVLEFEVIKSCEQNLSKSAAYFCLPMRFERFW